MVYITGVKNNYSNMKKKPEPISSTEKIDGLEYQLDEIYGTEFIMELQKLCGYRDGKAYSEISRFEYVSMLRGAWYSTIQRRRIQI